MNRQHSTLLVSLVAHAALIAVYVTVPVVRDHLKVIALGWFVLVLLVGWRALRAARRAPRSGA